jgi:hypothetical protein
MGFQEIDPKIERYNGEVELCSLLDVLSSVGLLVVHPTEEIELCFGGHTSGGFGGPNRPAQFLAHLEVGEQVRSSFPSPIDNDM